MTILAALSTITETIVTSNDRPGSGISIDEFTWKEFQTFNRITGFWRQKFADADSGCGLHLSDGPNGERLHVAVPKEVDACYRFPFTKEFLNTQLKDRGKVDREVAQDLLYLRHPRLFTRACRIAINNYDPVECTSYVVKYDSRALVP